MLRKIFRALTRTTTGRLIKQIDTPIDSAGSVTVSLRLKMEPEGPFVVMALTAPGNYQYCPMDLGEFDRLMKAMSDIRAAATDLQSPAQR